MKLSYLYSNNNVKIGDHLGCLYDVEEHLWALVMPFLRRGLEVKEKVLYIAESSFVDLFMKYIQYIDFNPSAYIQNQQLVFLNYEQSYLQNGAFSTERMLDFWDQNIQLALQQGYKALRVITKMDWVLENPEYPQQIGQYEARLCQFITQQKMLILCQYDAQHLPAKMLMEVLRFHPIIMLGAEWIENIYYLPPSEFFSPHYDTCLFRHRLRSLWDHQQVEKDLYDGEERINEAQHIAHIGSWDINLNTHSLILSPEVYHILEIKPDIIPNYYSILNQIVHPEDRNLVISAYQNSVYNKLPYELVHRIVMADGRIKFVHQRFKTFFNQDGVPIRCIGTIQDITPRQMSENREEQRRKILEMIACGSPLNEILEKIIQIVEHENPGCLCSILLLDRQGQHLLHGSAPSLPYEYNESINGITIGEGVGSCGTAAYTKQRVIVSDIEQHPYWKKYRQLAQKIGVRSCWSEPIFSSTGTVLGTFAMYHHNPCSPSDQEIGWITAVSNFARLAIERKHAEETLRESEASYRTLAQNLPGLVYRVRLQTPSTMLFFNDMLETMTGFKEDELRQGEVCSITPLIVEEDRPLVIKKIEAAIEQDRPFEVEYRLRRKDGHLRYFNERGRSIREHNGKPAYIDGVIFDITERREAEDAMRQLYQQTQRDAKIKSTLLQEINHRVKNNLIAIQGLLLAEQQFAAHHGQYDISKSLDNVFHRIQGMLDVHQSLSESEWEPIRLSDLAQRIISSVLSTLPSNQKVEIDIRHSSVNVSPRQASNLALIFNELTTNTLKYGINGRNLAKISVEIQQDGDYIVLTYRDDGPGFPDAVTNRENPKYNVGFHLIDTIISRTLRGPKIQLSNQNGAVVTLRLKTEEMRRS